MYEKVGNGVKGMERKGLVGSGIQLSWTILTHARTVLKGEHESNLLSTWPRSFSSIPAEEHTQTHVHIFQ